MYTHYRLIPNRYEFKIKNVSVDLLNDITLL